SLPPGYGIVQHNPELCFSKENIERLEDDWKHGGMTGVDELTFTTQCFSKSYVELNDGNLTVKYYSTGKNVFHSTNDIDMFWIVNDWVFHWIYTDYGGDFYMMEGRCDLIR